jgi:hypothetical protein
MLANLYGSGRSHNQLLLWSNQTKSNLQKLRSLKLGPSSYGKLGIRSCTPVGRILLANNTRLTAGVMERSRGASPDLSQPDDDALYGTLAAAATPGKRPWDGFGRHPAVCHGNHIDSYRRQAAEAVRSRPI